MEELAVVGKSLPKLDAPAKATGQAQYGGDLKLSNMLYAAVLRSPLAHARILNLDVSQARKLTGVKTIITAQDSPKIKYGEIIKDRYPLALDKVRFIGDEIAAVAAVDQDTANYALELMKADYQELPAVFDPQRAMEPGAPLIHEGERNIAKHMEITRGEPEKGFQEADHIFEDRFLTPMVHQCYMEPLACLGDYDLSGKLTLWAPLQDYFIVRMVLAQVLGMSQSRIRIIQPYIGGAFGGKHIHQIEVICALLAKAARKPVKLVNSREEEFTTTLPRVPAIINLRTGVKKDGAITAKEMRVISDNGAYTGIAPAVMETTAMRTDSLYRYKNVKIAADLVYTNKVPTGAFRGFGNPQGTFAVESQMDMIAERLGMDPLTLRIKNGVKAGDVTVHGWIIRSCGLEECLRRAGESAGWRGKRGKRRPHTGIGAACMIHVSGNRGVFDFDGSSALVKMNEDGRVSLLTGENDTGQGVSTILAQIAAEELGVRLEDIDVPPVDTDVSPFGLGPYADRVTTIGGNAVKAAAADARHQLLKVAAEMLEANPDDLNARDGKIFVRGSPERFVTVAQATKAALYRPGGTPIMGRGYYDPDSVMPDRVTHYGNLAATYVFAAQVAEVEVDPGTGQVKVLNFVAAHDLGRAINPMAAEGQIEGSLAQGIGYALSEEIRHAAGRVINGQFADYKILNASDMPPVSSILVESDDPVGPFGAKGVGEPGLVPTAPAIANAIYNAVGVRIRELPITAEKVLKALKEKAHSEG